MIQNCVIVGRNVRAISVNKTGSGKSVANLTVAVDRKFGKTTDFINCVAWGQTAENLEKYLGAGKRVHLQGELHQTKKTKSGIEYDTYELNVEMFKVIDFTDKTEKQNEFANDEFPDFSSQQEDIYVNEEYDGFKVDDDPVLDITSDDLPF